MSRRPRLRCAPIALVALVGVVACTSSSNDPQCTAMGSGAPILDLASQASCSSSRPPEWLDLGSPPNAAIARTIAATDTMVFIGTDDGVWRRPVDGSGEWSRSGLSGRGIRTLLTAGPSVLLAGAGPRDGGPAPGTFHRSMDRGDTWCTAGQDRFIADVLGRAVGLPVNQLVRDPGGEGGGVGILYAVISGPSVAASNDGGASWRYVVFKQESYIGSPCVLGIAGKSPRRLYQGCEYGLDIAWVGYFDVSSRDVLGPPQDVLGRFDISNRRPNSISVSPWNSDIAYAGLEGGLVKLTPTGWSWVYFHPGEGPVAFGRFTFVVFTWVDPCNAAHLVFGGYTNVRQTFDLYETFDEGMTLALIAPPSEVAGGVVEGGTPTGPGGRDIAVLEAASSFPSGFRVLIRRYSP